MERPLRWVFPLGVVLALAATFAVVLTHPTAPRYDQAALVGFRLNLDGYPTFNDEVVPRLISALLFALGPRSPLEANTTLRLVAGALYVGAAALLTSRVLSTGPARAGLLALLFASGYPYLWLSSELIAGALTCAAVWLILTERPPWLVGATLALLALTKSELALASVVIAALYAWQHRSAILALAIGFACVAAAAVVPGILVHGSDFWATRSWFAFSQSYALMVAPLQVGAHPDPLKDWHAYVRDPFPGQSSVLGVILHQPDQYERFVALSIREGVWNLWRAFGLVLVAIGVRIGLRGSAIRPIEKWLLAASATLIPEVMISFPHVRYLAKLAPMILMVPLAEIESRRGGWRIVMVVLLAAAGVLSMLDRIQAPGTEMWFPD